MPAARPRSSPSGDGRHASAGCVLDNNRYYQGMTAVEHELDLVRQRLVEAAAEVFSERGYDGAGVQEIARRAGLTTGAIYGRFTGKAELLREAIDPGIERRARRAVHPAPLRGPGQRHLRIAGAHLVDRPDEDAHIGNALLLEAFVAARRDPEILDARQGASSRSGAPGSPRSSRRPRPTAPSIPPLDTDSARDASATPSASASCSSTPSSSTSRSPGRGRTSSPDSSWPLATNPTSPTTEG